MKYTANEMCVLIGCSLNTLNYWYAFKRLNENTTDPDIKRLIDLLPEYTQDGARQKRLWDESDVFKLVQFKNSVPHGRNGVLGDVTQKHIKNRKQKH